LVLEPWGGRDVAPGFVEPIVAPGGTPIIFHFGVDSYAIGLSGSAVRDEATLQGALTLPAGPVGSADEGGGGGPWISYGEAAGDVFRADPVNVPGTNFLQFDEAAMALLAPFVPVAPPYWATMEDDLDALEDVGTNTLWDGTPVETGNTHDRVAATSGVNGGTHLPDLGDPNNPNHDPINGNPIIFSVDRGADGTAGSAVRSQILDCNDGASGDLFIAVTIPQGPYAGMTTNMLLIDEGQIGLMPYDDLDAVILKLLIPVDILEERIFFASENFFPEPTTYNQGAGFTDPLIYEGEAVVGFSVDNASIGLLYSAVDFECRVDGMGLSGPGYSGSGVMEQGGDIFYSNLLPPPAQQHRDPGTSIPYGQNYLWFEETAIGLDRGNWQLTAVTGDLSLSPDELNALDSGEASGGCTTVNECNDFDACTYDECVAGVCMNTPRTYGDIDGNGVISLFDIFCILDLIGGGSADPACNATNADIEPCAGNGALSLLDVFAVLDAIAGIDPCGC
jgi:hypothetical protein